MEDSSAPLRGEKVPNPRRLSLQLMQISIILAVLAASTFLCVKYHLKASEQMMRVLHERVHEVRLRTLFGALSLVSVVLLALKTRSLVGRRREK